MRIDFFYVYSILNEVVHYIPKGGIVMVLVLQYIALGIIVVIFVLALGGFICAGKVFLKKIAEEDSPETDEEAEAEEE